ncbi:MAG: AMP-dependent synthetase [Deltaproteobacteria bacterium]|nr:MAG: AMP-dependent synthetase [Deltaproteobacteria bacterium]
MDEYRWLKNYDPGVPHSLEPYPQKTLIDYVDDAAKERPDATMLIFKKRKMTYAEVQKLSDELAAALAAKGVKKGDRVVLLMPNCPQAIICRLGTWKAGGILVHINPLYTDSELEHALKDCGAETVFVLTTFYNQLKRIQPRTDIKLVIATNIKEYLPPVLKILFTILKERKEGHYVTLQPGDCWLQDVIKENAGANRPDVAVLPADYALILFSGGTTGTPKGVVGTHHSQVVTGLQFQSWFGIEVERYKDVLMASLPLFHSFATYAVMSTAMVVHLPMSLVPNPRDRNDLIKTIQHDRPAFFPAVPALYIALLEHPMVKSGKVDFKSMKFCVSGAAPLLAETKRRFEALTGGRIVEGYALTETTMAACVTPYLGKWKEGSTGMPLPDVVVRIGDIETGEGEMPPGKEGEIVFKAPQLMAGYWNKPEETKEMLRDGWLYTGDIGYMDEDGYLFITSRKKDLIKPSGFQVWPREVEEVITTHPAVAEASVAGIFDAKQGEAVKAWVVLKAGTTATAEEIQGWCKEKLVAYKIPKFVEFRDALPKTMVGKVLRRILVEEENAKRKNEGV